MKKRLKIYKSSSQAARQPVSPAPVTPVAPVAENNVTKAEPARCRISSKKGKRTTSRAKGNLTNKTEVNLLRKPKSMAQPHPVKRWAATRAEQLKGGDGGKDRGQLYSQCEYKEILQLGLKSFAAS